eukprot:CAMPEP_0184493400 /NCGR_PEP_ID=MMETSP0113_2-20130426/25912_1 /TAXON_ID=91329 /ORGANISM="Norrisiella sphaerica, Strain BC52" /LENGTH=243 /DNA_ID=CAMNT_0026878645 /DNA_START=214 /DNA_END=941 /DNA_ORIENTATION=-
MDILITTPGTAKKLSSQRKGKGIELDRLQAIVVDEADQVIASEERSGQPLARFLALVSKRKPDTQLVFAAATMSRTAWDQNLKPILKQSWPQSRPSPRRIDSTGLHRIPTAIHQSFRPILSTPHPNPHHNPNPDPTNPDAAAGNTNEELMRRLCTLWDILDSELGGCLTGGWSPAMDGTFFDEDEDDDDDDDDGHEDVRLLKEGEGKEERQSSGKAADLGLRDSLDHAAAEMNDFQNEKEKSG